MLYNLGVSLYGLGIKVSAAFNPKAKKWIEGRKDYWEQLPTVSDKNVVWFHCASLGEYDQGKPVMEAWKEKHPNDFLLVTFFSPSGYEAMIDKSLGDYTCYLPLDTPSNAKRFITHFQPKTTFFVKYEIWINHLKEAKKAGSKLFSISASFRKDHRFFKWYGGKFRKTLRLFDHIFVQKEESAQLLKKINISQVTVSGDTRYDRVIQRAEANKENEIIAPWAKDEEIFVVGSSWTPDEEIIIPFINDFKIQTKVIIAPHEVHKEHIEDLTERLRVSYQLYTDIEKGEELKPTTMVLILDCIGVLADAYKYGTLAYVGGAFGTGLHNILEPAAFGLPVIFGPHHQKFPEAQDFIVNNIGNSCDDNKSFSVAYEYYRGNRQARERVRNFVNLQRGATEVVLKTIERLD